MDGEGRSGRVTFRAWEPESEPGVFGSLEPEQEPEPEPLKKTGAGVDWKKSQEPEPLKN